jgi:hypothetical protein
VNVPWEEAAEHLLLWAVAAAVDVSDCMELGHCFGKTAVANEVHVVAVAADSVGVVATAVMAYP